MEPAKPTLPALLLPVTSPTTGDSVSGETDEMALLSQVQVKLEPLAADPRSPPRSLLTPQVKIEAGADGVLADKKVDPRLSQRPKKFNWLALIKGALSRATAGNAAGGIDTATLYHYLGRIPEVTARNNWDMELAAFLNEAVQRRKLRVDERGLYYCVN